ncbi:MAG: class I SAM-dependent methyltransferase [Chitinophagales bacterium]
MVNDLEGANSEIWEKIFLENEWGKYPESSLIRFVAKNFYKHPNRVDVKILELGSGPGANLWYLTREGFSAYAIEFTKIATEKSIKRLELEGTIKNLQQIKTGDYSILIDEFPDDYFDAVIDMESLYCNSFEKTKLIVGKIIQKLKNNGKFLSVTFAENCWGFEGDEVEYHAVVAEDGPLKGKGYSRYSTRQDIEALYGTQNLKIVNLERIEKHLNNGKVISEWVVESIKAC